MDSRSIPPHLRLLNKPKPSTQIPHSHHLRDTLLPKLLSGELRVSDRAQALRALLMSELKTCFKKVDYDLSGLLHYIEIGDIGLPDIQRPFVWSNAKVRDLFDSMYRGFPGRLPSFLGKRHGRNARSRSVSAASSTGRSPLIVDGQQRLTSLFAVFRGTQGARRRLQGTADRSCLPASRWEIRGGRRGHPPRPGMDRQYLRRSGHPGSSSRQMVNGFLKQAGSEGAA